MANKIWKPHKRQEDFISLPDSIFEAFFGGAAGPGKSECLMMLPIVREFYKHPRFKGLLLRRTHPELDREIVPRSVGPYKATGGEYSDQKKRWQWPSGAIMQFGHAEHEKDVRNYDTAEYNYVAFDELTSFTWFQYEYIAYSRCRTSTKELPAIVRSASNPGNVGHGPVRDYFIKPAPLGYTILRKKVLVGGVEKSVNRIFIPAKATDNPYIDPNYIVRLQLLPEAERVAKAEGDWWTFSGQVFDDWRFAPRADEPPNACHVIEPFTIPVWWPRIIGIDWGFSAMTWVGWAAIDPLSHVIYLYREYTAKNTKISEWAQNVAKLSVGENIVDIVLDPSAWGNRGDDFTIAEQFDRYSGLRSRPADNDRIGGKNLIQELLRWKANPILKQVNTQPDMEIAIQIFDLKGKKAYQDYVNSFKEEKVETALPKIKVFNTCSAIINTIPLCVYNDVTTSKTGNPEDVAEFDGDDPYDGFRYLVKACQYYLDVGRKESIVNENVSAAIQNFSKNKDYNQFYRAMSKVDSTKCSNRVKRYHGRSQNRNPYCNYRVTV